MGLEQEYELRLMKPKEQYAEEIMLFMWAAHDKLSVIQTPR